MELESKIFLVNENDSNQRIDSYIAEKIPQISRSEIQKLIKNEFININGKLISKNYKLKVNDRITIKIPKKNELKVIAQEIPLDVIYEDDDLIIVNKPKGMVVHPAAGNEEKTLANALLYHYGENLSNLNGNLRPGIIHRIDKDTSGLLIVAKNNFSHEILSKQISKHSFKREYEAVVYGNLKEDFGNINKPIGRSQKDRKKMAVTNLNSKEAITYFEVINRYKNFTHVKLNLKTGRTHQIRVHMASIGHPVAGDKVYGPKKIIKSLNGQCLHAKTIGFVHPKSNKYMEFCSELPLYFKEFLKKLGDKNVRY